MTQNAESVCPKHGEPWLPGVAPFGYRRCTYYVPELGVSENYGCPQPAPTDGSGEP